MKLGIVGTGTVGCACAMAAVNRGSAREIVLVNRTRKTAEAVATDMRYGTPLGARIDITDGDYDALAGAGDAHRRRQREERRRHRPQRPARAAAAPRQER